MRMEIETAEAFVADDIERRKRGVIDYTVKGRCSECGECCGRFLPLAKADKRQIHQYVKAHSIPEYTSIFQYHPEAHDFTCPFLDKQKLNHKCRIYEVRPEICRLFKCNMEPRYIGIRLALQGRRPDEWQTPT